VGLDAAMPLRAGPGSTQSVSFEVPATVGALPQALRVVFVRGTVGAAAVLKFAGPPVRCGAAGVRHRTRGVGSS
jgi:hypothetical protein